MPWVVARFLGLHGLPPSPISRKDNNNNKKRGDFVGRDYCQNIKPPVNDGENKSGGNENEIENPPRTETTKRATAAFEILIAYMEQYPKLQLVSDH